MPEQFSQETLTEIFKYLNDDEHGSDDLFNCLLMNRYWCKAAIPVLWSAPFKYADVLPLDGVIDAYVACLTRKEREELLGKGIIIDHPIPKKVAFDYVNYLKDFNYFGFMASLFHWGCSSTGIYKMNNLYSNMLPAFLQIFSRREIRLKSLELVNRDGLGVWENEFMHLVKPENHRLIGSVRKLYLDMEIVDGNFFTRISDVCRNLKSLHIIVHSKCSVKGNLLCERNAECYGEIIRQQLSLESIIIQDFKSYFSHILPALTTQAHSLHRVEFIKADFTKCESFDGLLFCENLEMLKFTECCNIDKCLLEPLFKVKFKRHAVMEMENMDYNVDALRKLKWDDVSKKSTSIYFN